MPLIKDGAVTSTIHICGCSTMRRCRTRRPVLLPAARFLADARNWPIAPATTGVIWPNDRDVAELAPYLDRLALVALVFPELQGRPRL